MRVVLLAGLLSLTGCAAIFKGGKQDVRVVAIPDGADVRLDNQFAGESPTTVRVDRNASQHIVVSKDGFKDQQVTVQRHPDTPWWIWDIATCAIPVLLCIPLGVDALSGAWFSLDDEVRVKLDPLPAAARPPSAPKPEPWTPPAPLNLSPAPSPQPTNSTEP
jgi:hypothetical protein